MTRFLESRKLSSRLIVEGRLVLGSPARIGGEDPDAPTDAPLLRGADGAPYLPGASLKGVFRSLSPTGGVELFGDVWGTAASRTTGARQARLLFDDATVVARNGEVPTEIRDGVAIEPSLGIAAGDKKFDGEWLPAGTELELRLELLLAGDGLDDQRCSELVTLLAAVESGEVAVGARTSRGFGATEVAERGSPPEEPWRWTLRRFDWETAEGLFAWLGEDMGDLGPSWPRATPFKARDAAELARELGCAKPQHLARASVVFHLDLEVAGSLLVRGPGDAPGDATRESDAAHLGRRRFSGLEEMVIPGTSLAGVLRHRCLRIARTLLPDSRKPEAEALVEGMFGAIVSRRTGARGGARKSRVRVPEMVVRDGERRRHTRVRIDPWTGGAADALLFSEDALFGGRVEGRLRLYPRESRSGGDPLPLVEKAILLLAIRDLATGDLRVGSEGAAGRGLLRPGGDNGLFVTMGEGPREMRLLCMGHPAVVKVEPQGADREYMDALEEWRTTS